jgi:hypothetical protein
MLCSYMNSTGKVVAEEVKKDTLDEIVPLLLIINVKKETENAMQSIYNAEEDKEEAKILEDKLRPIRV